MLLHRSSLREPSLWVWWENTPSNTRSSMGRYQPVAGSKSAASLTGNTEFISHAKGRERKNKEKGSDWHLMCFELKGKWWLSLFGDNHQMLISVLRCKTDHNASCFSPEMNGLCWAFEERSMYINYSKQVSMFSITDGQLYENWGKNSKVSLEEEFNLHNVVLVFHMPHVI